MKALIVAILLLSLLVNTKVLAQYENVWICGSSAALDFNTGGPTALQVPSAGGKETYASVCDKNGTLLFYTDGSFVWDKNHVMMPNGSALTGLGIIGGTATSITNSTSQGALIVPMPDNASQYYVFSLTQIEAGADAGKLFYSVVDMTLNGGLGDVVPNKKGILLDSNLVEKLTGIAGDRCNIWVLVHSNIAPDFKSYEVTRSGVNHTPVISTTGIISHFYYLLGEMKPSPDRKKLLACAAFTGRVGGLELFDFDPATGIVSNPVVLDKNQDYYSGAFSPDNTKVYGSSNGGLAPYVCQFDLAAPDPTTTKTLLGPGHTLTKIKLAPDGKIYTRSNGSGLSVIHSPNTAGTACQFVENDFPLLPGTSIGYGLPNLVPVYIRDTAAYTGKNIKAACWATAYTIRANNTGWDYRWDDGTNSASRTITTPGTYWVTYTGPPCRYHVDTFKVAFQPPLPQAGSVNGCNQNIATANSAWVLPAAGDTTEYTYTWKAGSHVLQTGMHRGADTLFNILPGTYHVHLQGNNGCDTTLTITIDPPEYQALFDMDTAICQSDTLRLTNTSTGNFVSWLWQFGDGDTSTTEDPIHKYLQPGKFQITLIGATSYPCYDTIQRTIVIDTIPYVSFLTDRDSICTGSAVNLYPQYTSGIIELRWQYGDGITSQNLYAHSYILNTVGQYVIDITGRYPHCPDTTFSDTLHIYPYPIVNIGPDTAICPGSNAIELANQFTAGADYLYRWSTGALTPAISINEPGIYYLTATANNCATTDTVEIHRSCFIEIPNAFSPNGDGINDYFFPKDVLSRALTQFSMQVYNRWGQKMFETNNLNGRGWDGRCNDISQPEGVYIYSIKASFTSGHEEKYQGNITLIR